MFRELGGAFGADGALGAARRAVALAVALTACCAVLMIDTLDGSVASYFKQKFRSFEPKFRSFEPKFRSFEHRGCQIDDCWLFTAAADPTRRNARVVRRTKAAHTRRDVPAPARRFLSR